MTTLLNLIAAIALLVWGTNIVRTGVLRVYGAGLRQVLRRSMNGQSTAFLAGLAVTGLLQSSTATALLTSSFVAQGLLTTAAALAVMLGADVGTAAMVQVLSLNLKWLAPLAITVGVVVYLSRRNERAGQIGRIVLGFGVMILALQLISAATAPLAHGAGVKTLFAQISGDILLDVVIGAVFAILCYSSLAVVLLVATLAGSNVLPAHVAISLVLGANLGSGVLAMLTTWRSDAVTRRAPLGNFIFKAAGVALALALLPFVTPWLRQVEMNARDLVVIFHLGFNVVLALAFMHFTGKVAELAEKWLPDSRSTENGAQPRYLDPVALATPALALGNAAREAIRLADTVQDMLAGLLTVLRNNDAQLADALRRRDDEIDRLYSAIKRYLAQVSREALDAGESRRWTEVIQFTINMEHVGDIIERGLLDVAERKIRHGLSFSDAGIAEITDLHARLVANLQLTVAVFLNGDLKSAQSLMSEKVAFRELEMRYADQHLLRLSDNTRQSIETSSLHLDLLADFKRINSLFCSVAYPILESAGVLSKTRLLGEAAPVFPTNETRTT
ncbi:MAG TPA: Na/Pi cotransporter family protein [Burkholderiaceae bacterium]|nr:Na/Pi cotransporter family protein [Burkholderiaceae bacterium]